MADFLFGQMRRWWMETPLRALERAYEAALKIKAIENEHFNGDPIGPEGGHSDSVFRYFLAQLRRQLKIIQTGLAEFRASSSMTGPPQDPPVADPKASRPPEKARGEQLSGSLANQTAPNGAADPLPASDRLSVLDKLRLVDTLVARYTPLPQPLSRRSPAARQAIDPLNDLGANPNATSLAQTSSVSGSQASKALSSSDGGSPAPELAPSPSDPKSRAARTSVVPRSIFRTANRLRRELNSGYEQEMVDEARESRTRTMTSLRFLALLAILPVIAQIASKNLVFEPLVEYFRSDEPQSITLTMEFEEQALMEFNHYKEQLEFKHFLAGEVEEDNAQTEDQLRQKAVELIEKYGYRSVEGLKNVFADLFSLAVFAWLIAIGREEIEILKSFLDQIVYGLSDSAKAFIIILFTDVFVGYHSPHGWEVLLSGLARHLGIMENQEITFAFIATFPVFLDTLFKYWIFRYLNRISPSAVATYKSMNE
ncbi:MAG: proton extrusion protein PcxA [Synechococcaceae cyanobacterium RM1_1_27]|nr:proton extrusion protein PcxA [Synechococcaceae cyanobacterium SM2_3_2]NJO85583.1 proton extrusion protein PcxA [Synechococcaceae cyanobacterium RM1_1_27]